MFAFTRCLVGEVLRNSAIAYPKGYFYRVHVHTGVCTTEYHSTTEYQFFYFSYKILRKRAIYFIFVNIY